MDLQIASATLSRTVATVEDTEIISSVLFLGGFYILKLGANTWWMLYKCIQQQINIWFYYFLTSSLIPGSVVKAEKQHIALPVPKIY